MLFKIFFQKIISTKEFFNDHLFRIEEHFFLILSHNDEVLKVKYYNQLFEDVL